ncbi:MAG: 3-phosphoshikimate 1-carboxyvinyltransferase [Pirellulales bacterium]|nr:3-phosphoshikimate 1-carboxyvinyltransferase [Pirellulales bacterium]
MVCAALADGDSLLRGVLDSEDTQVMIESLGRLGVRVRLDASTNTATVAGLGGNLSAADADLYIANSGTTVRFLTALATLGCSEYRMHGTERMHERPIADLLSALAQLGAKATSENGNGCPPILVHGNGLPGGTCQVRGDISSQFLSALLMVAPCAQSDVTIEVEGELVSQPYVKMTLSVMSQFGVAIDGEAGPLDHFVIRAPQTYGSREYAIEPDASAASYFLAAAAIAGGEVEVQGLSRSSLQGDVRFAEVWREMGATVRYREDSICVAGGALRGIDVDMNDISDTVQTLAAVALFADGPTTIRGVAHNRFKETDRIRDLATELRRLGAVVNETDDGLRITPSGLRPAKIETYDDHRMAMSMSLVGLRQPGVVIKNPSCTSKTYPGFFADLDQLTTGAKK